MRSGEQNGMLTLTFVLKYGQAEGSAAQEITLLKIKLPFLEFIVQQTFCPTIIFNKHSTKYKTK